MARRSTETRSGVGGGAWGVGLALLLAVAAFGAALAQDATPDPAARPASAPDNVARAAEIFAGTCDDDDGGEVVAPLSDLTPPEGEPVGQAAAVTADRSFSNVPLSIETLAAEAHAIRAFASDDATERPVACGEIGGNLDETGALQIGIRERDGSGLTGIAYLSPNADGVSTDVSLFLVAGPTGAGGANQAAGETEPIATETEPATVEPAASPRSDDDEPVDELDGPLATPAAAATTPTPTPEPEPTEIPSTVIDVSLTEFAIDMPTSLATGRVTFDIANDGAVAHSFVIEGDGLDEALDGRLQSGETDALTVELEPGNYLVYCPVGNHADQGMEIEIVVA